MKLTSIWHFLGWVGEKRVETARPSQEIHATGHDDDEDEENVHDDDENEGNMDEEDEEEEEGEDENGKEIGGNNEGCGGCCQVKECRFIRNWPPAPAFTWRMFETHWYVSRNYWN